MYCEQSRPAKFYNKATKEGIMCSHDSTGSVERPIFDSTTWPPDALRPANEGEFIGDLPSIPVELLKAPPPLVSIVDDSEVWLARQRHGQ